MNKNKISIMPEENIQMSKRHNSLRKDHSERKRKLLLDMARSIGNDKHLRRGNIPWVRPRGC